MSDYEREGKHDRLEKVSRPAEKGEQRQQQNFSNEKAIGDKTDKGTERARLVPIPPTKPKK